MGQIADEVVDVIGDLGGGQRGVKTLVDRDAVETSEGVVTVDRVGDGLAVGEDRRVRRVGVARIGTLLLTRDGIVLVVDLLIEVGVAVDVGLDGGEAAVGVVGVFGDAGVRIRAEAEISPSCLGQVRSVKELLSRMTFSPYAPGPDPRVDPEPLSPQQHEGDDRGN